MPKLTILPSNSIGANFIPAEYLPENHNQFTFRNQQVNKPDDYWRKLKSEEIERLVKNNNTATDWSKVLVTDEFDTDQILNNRFFGLVRIGSVRDVVIKHHDLQLPVGITNSIVVSCDIGDDVAIHNVGYLSYYIIGDRCIISNVNELNTCNHAKFGNGIVKEGEPEKIRVWLELMNETGCRGVAPFDGMIAADAYMWARYRDDEALMKALTQITQNSFDTRRGYYGTIGDECVVKNSFVIKDVKVGTHCYIKGANKLKNLTINSSIEEPTQIGEGVELVNGIIGYGCHIFYGCKAVRFVMGNNSNLKYGARLINSFLGDNSTISCCEVLNNLIFPAHEQHHNNSFLVAALVMGQSNLAAGATIGSNHNSRANDNEVQAGRGFWPGLCTSIKHSCRFASFVMLSKADYPAEMYIPFPFSLLNNNVSKDQLEVTPAFWWMYNMYALERNTWKFKGRDARQRKVQHIELEALAPDSVEEIFDAMYLLELWVGKAFYRKQQQNLSQLTDEAMQQQGKELLFSTAEAVNALEVLGEGMEKTKRKVLIIKAYQSYHAYRDMVYYYAVNTIFNWMQHDTSRTFADMVVALQGNRETKWANFGGQLMREQDVDALRQDIGNGKLTTWNQIHQRYDSLWEQYPLQKQQHAYASLCSVLGVSNLTQKQWLEVLDKSLVIQEFVKDQVYLSRKKDFDNPYRRMTFRNEAEMTAAIGTIEDNGFVKEVRQMTVKFNDLVKEIKQRG